MPEADGLPSLSRALVRLATDAADERPVRAIRPPATFLAHLIATARQLPQARERRRAEPGEAIAAYQSAIAKLRAFSVQ